MQTILNIYKPKYFTPLEMIQKVKSKFPEYTDVPMTYAGRLDPLAHGTLLLLAGDEVKNREQYLALPKTYEFEILFSISTDSYDTLGLIQSIHNNFKNKAIEKTLPEFIAAKTGKHLQQYPPYSSKTVHGKPLFWWAKNNKLHEIEIPSREIAIYEFSMTGSKTISSDEVVTLIEQQTLHIHGDFRQKEILHNWQENFADKKIDFPVYSFRIRCSSGTYVRGLSHDLGTTTGLGAITTDIFRTSIGEYTVEDALQLEQ